jgi:hypothetical protein
MSASYNEVMSHIEKNGSQLFPRLKVVTSNHKDYDKIRFSSVVKMDYKDKNFDYLGVCRKTYDMPTSHSFDSLEGALKQFKEDCLNIKNHGIPVSDNLSDGVDDGFVNVLFYKIKK